MCNQQPYYVEMALCFIYKSLLSVTLILLPAESSSVVVHISAVMTTNSVDVNLFYILQKGQSEETSAVY
jgi:hypothetical protein